MKKIASFTVDHTKLGIGMYISRIDEHLFATYARNTEHADHVVYVGPMGCRTGFYFITRNLPHETAIEIVRQSMEFVKDFEGEIPGATEPECGNYLEHDLPSAKRDVIQILEKLENYSVEQLQYNC